MFPDDPFERFRREMEKMNTLQRELAKATSLNLLGRIGSVELRVLEDAFSQHKKIEEMKRQLGGLDTTELATWIEESRTTKMMQDFLIHVARSTSA